MKKTTLIELEVQRIEVAKQIRRYMDPFVVQDKGDIRALKYNEDVLQGKIHREASHFLKINGFRADGFKRKTRK